MMKFFIRFSLKFETANLAWTLFDWNPLLGWVVGCDRGCDIHRVRPQISLIYDAVTANDKRHDARVAILYGSGDDGKAIGFLSAVSPVSLRREHPKRITVECQRARGPSRRDSVGSKIT